MSINTLMGAARERAVSYTQNCRPLPDCLPSSKQQKAGNRRLTTSVGTRAMPVEGKDGRRYRYSGPGVRLVRPRKK
jgi:hypothetical protein